MEWHVPSFCCIGHEAMSGLRKSTPRVKVPGEGFLKYGISENRCTSWEIKATLSGGRWSCVNVLF